MIEAILLENAGSRKRYSFPLALTYRAIGKREDGAGTKADMSGARIRITPRRELRCGDLLELALLWPARLNPNVGPKLVLKALVVRSRPGEAAAKITGHQFRTLDRQWWGSRTSEQF